MSLPTDTRGKAAGGAYFKPEAGNNKVLILGDVITGYQYWTNAGDVHRSPDMFEETPDIRVRKDDKTGEEKAEKQQFFWAVPVHNFDTESVEVWQITQKGIRDQLSALESNEDWGDPTGSYTITINKKGEGLETKYNVTPNPTEKDKEIIAEAVKQYKEAPMDLNSIFFGETEA